MSEKIKITLLKALLRSLVKPMFGPPLSYPLQRVWLNAMSAVSIKPRQTQVKLLKVANVPVHQVSNAATPGSPTDNVILYLHGGAYCIGSAKTHGGLTAHLAKKCRAKVFVPEYRLAPEHSMPAAIEDCLNCYEWLLSEGHKPSQITIAGDSAGAGLVMATALRLKEKNLAQPAGLVLMSPWVDLTLENFNKVNDKIDPLLRWSNLNPAAKLYLNGTDPKDPLASAIFADLSGLAPMLIQVGSEEILLGDAQKLYDQAQKCQVDVSFNLYQQGWHVFQLQAGLLNMADQAIDEISLFIENVTAATDIKKMEAPA